MGILGMPHIHQSSETVATNSTMKILWSDIRPLGVEGRGWNDTKAFMTSAGRAETLVRQTGLDLSRNSAGMCVRFVTDATAIHARWVLTDPWLYQPNATAICVSGLDFTLKPARLALARGRIPKSQTNEETLVKNLLPGKREYLLYLPLYNGVKSVELGRPLIQFWKSPRLGRRRTPAGLFFIGTSILQGLSASRPGMVHSAILGRKFNWPTINLGFSGNGKNGTGMAGLLAGLDPAVYVLDCLPNMVADESGNASSPLYINCAQRIPGRPSCWSRTAPCRIPFSSPAAWNGTI